LRVSRMGQAAQVGLVVFAVITTSQVVVCYLEYIFMLFL
jgi:hypothetical protein